MALCTVKHAFVAQRIEQVGSNDKVGGSNPSEGTTFSFRKPEGPITTHNPSGPETRLKRRNGYASNTAQNQSPTATSSPIRLRELPMELRITS